MIHLPTKLYLVVLGTTLLAAPAARAERVLAGEAGDGATKVTDVRSNLDEARQKHAALRDGRDPWPGLDSVRAGDALGPRGHERGTERDDARATPSTVRLRSLLHLGGRSYPLPPRIEAWQAGDTRGDRSLRSLPLREVRAALGLPEAKVTASHAAGFATEQALGHALKAGTSVGEFLRERGWKEVAVSSVFARALLADFGVRQLDADPYHVLGIEDANALVISAKYYQGPDRAVRQLTIRHTSDPAKLQVERKTEPSRTYIELGFQFAELGAASISQDSVTGRVHFRYTLPSSIETVAVHHGADIVDLRTGTTTAEPPDHRRGIKRTREVTVDLSYAGLPSYAEGAKAHDVRVEVRAGNELLADRPVTPYELRSFAHAAKIHWTGENQRGYAHSQAFLLNAILANFDLLPTQIRGAHSPYSPRLSGTGTATGGGPNGTFPEGNGVFNASGTTNVPRTTFGTGGTGGQPGAYAAGQNSRGSLGFRR